MTLNVFLSIWEMFLLSSPGLLFGFALAGLIHALIRPDLISKHLQTPGFISNLKASAFGAPLPLCSCSVVPVAVTLRKRGASKGATSSFMISTPEIGIDSFILSFFLLGPFLAIMRVIAAFFSALSVGSAIDRFASEEQPKTSRLQVLGAPSSSPAEKPKRTIKEIIVEASRFAFVEIVDDLAVVLTLGIIIAGLISALVPPGAFAELNLSLPASMLLMLVISLPFYVCATASTPLGLAFLAKGVPAGAVLVFLLAGPASNVTTFLAIRKELGTRALVIYLAGLAITTIFFGALVHYLVVSGYFTVISPEHLHEHVHETGIFSTLCAAVVIVLLLNRLLPRVMRKASAAQAAERPSCCH